MAQVCENLLGRGQLMAIPIGMRCCC